MSVVSFGSIDNRFVPAPQTRQTDLISIDCLILFGLIQCKGDMKDKARVLYRIISPE